MLEKTSKGAFDVEDKNVEVKEDKNVEVNKLKVKIYDSMARIEQHNQNINIYIKKQLEDNVDALKIQVLKNNIKDMTLKMIELSK